MNDVLFYVLWSTPLLALFVNPSCWRYVIIILITSLIVDVLFVDLSDENYFLASAIIDLICIYLLSEIALVYALSFVLNIAQFMSDSIYQATGNYLHFYALILLQLAALMTMRGEDVGGISNVNKNAYRNKFSNSRNSGAI